MTVRETRIQAALAAVVLIAGLLWGLLPGAVEPFTQGMEYHDRVVVSGNLTEWETREANATITLFYDHGAHEYIVSSFYLDGEEYGLADFPLLHRGEEGESLDHGGNFWYVTLPSSSARGAFGRAFRLLGGVLLVLTGAVGWTLWQRRRVTRE